MAWNPRVRILAEPRLLGVRGLFADDRKPLLQRLLRVLMIASAVVCAGTGEMARCPVSLGTADFRYRVVSRICENLTAGAQEK